MLVCLAVWLAYAGRSVADKILALILLVSAFIAAGFEHCVANMYFLPLAWLMTSLGKDPAGFGASTSFRSLSAILWGALHSWVPCIGRSIGQRLARTRLASSKDRASLN